MAVIRATALSSFPELVREVGGDPDRLLAQVGIDPSDVGRPDVFVPLHSAVTVLEIAAKEILRMRELLEELASKVPPAG